jgi:hypothetical protein
LFEGKPVPASTGDKRSIPDLIVKAAMVDARSGRVPSQFADRPAKAEPSPINEQRARHDHHSDIVGGFGADLCDTAVLRLQPVTSDGSRVAVAAFICSIREETQMDFERITHPLRLAGGSHQPESGKGYAMNVISYINGDTHITDFPDCSARPLAAFVQACNDLLAGPDGYLSPKNSFLALELGFQTVGTTDVTDAVIHAWVAELLSSPAWGVIRYPKRAAAKVISDIAELHRRAAGGDMPSIAAWDADKSRRSRHLPRGWSHVTARRNVCDPGRIPLDRTCGYRPPGNTRCRNRIRLAGTHA